MSATVYFVKSSTGSYVRSDKGVTTDRNAAYWSFVAGRALRFMRSLDGTYYSLSPEHLSDDEINNLGDES